MELTIVKDSRLLTMKMVPHGRSQSMLKTVETSICLLTDLWRPHVPACQFLQLIISVRCTAVSPVLVESSDDFIGTYMYGRELPDYKREQIGPVHATWGSKPGLTKPR